MSRKVSQKMGVKEGMRAFFLNAPESALNAINLPGLDVGIALQGEFDYLHFFTKTQAEMVAGQHNLRGNSHSISTVGQRRPLGLQKQFKFTQD